MMSIQNYLIGSKITVDSMLCVGSLEDHNTQELADILEVIYALGALDEVNRDELEGII